MLKIHAIQTGVVRVKQFQLTGASNKISRFYQLLFTQKWSEWLPIYCWLIIINDQFVLVDTGETSQINETGYLPEGGIYHKSVQTRISKNDEIDQQLKLLGYNVNNVSTIILTHLHGDHIGGIKHFPNAKFLVSKTEYDFAKSKKGRSNGYFPNNWPSWFKPELIEYDNLSLGNFPRSFQFKSLKNITLVPTPGHSIGHQSVIVQDSPHTYFLGGDLTYNIETLQKKIPNAILPDKDAHNSVKLAHEYVNSKPCIFLSSHDWNVPKLLKER